MLEIENQCVDCGFQCIGNSCVYKNVHINYCDACGNDYAKYKVGDDDYCEKCIEEYLLEEFNSLTLLEKCKILDIQIKKCD